MKMEARPIDHNTELLASVIIPMRNEARYIGTCLDSVLANDQPASSYEVIVVDGMSTDASREIAQDRLARFPRGALLSNPRKVVPSSMNIGIRHSAGRYIIRLDAHAEYPPDYIRCCIEELERTGADNVGGSLITRPGGESNSAVSIALLTQEPAVVGNAAHRTGRERQDADTVPFGAFRRDVFERVGLFREDLVRHQDFELNARIRAAGGKIVLSRKISSVYYNVSSFSKFMRQAYLNGLWCARAWTRYPVCFCWRHAAPLVFVAGLITTLALATFVHGAIWLFAAGLLTYMSVALYAGVRISIQHGMRHLLLAPVLMFSYHFTYGVCTLAGFGVVVFEKIWRTAPVTEPARLERRQAT